MAEERRSIRDWGFIVAPQAQSLPTKACRQNVLKRTDIDPRLCRIHEETVELIVAGCPILARKENITRHNNVAAHIHQNVCEHYNTPTETSLWYKHEPKENDDITKLLDMPINTDRT